MFTNLRENGSIRFAALAAIGAALIGGALFTTALRQDAAAKEKAPKIVKDIAKKLKTAQKSEAKADYFLALARAAALTDEDERDEAIDEAKEEFKEEKQLAGDQFKARQSLAIDLGETGLYSVDIDPANFVAVIDNPLMPLIPGTVLTYEGDTEDGTETIVVTVTDDTKEILGVTCTVVRDTVTIDGELVEDTYDWFAQDTAGNVWYFGEISFEYEDGEISGTDGSWVGGIDGAQPGIVMKAQPMIGDIYRQEYYIGEAEDYAEVLSLTASASVPFGDFNGTCLQTFDGSPMEPEVEENKYYAPGIGVVLEVDLEEDERVELISRTTR